MYAVSQAWCLPCGGFRLWLLSVWSLFVFCLFFGVASTVVSWCVFLALCTDEAMAMSVVSATPYPCVRRQKHCALNTAAFARARCTLQWFICRCFRHVCAPCCAVHTAVTPSNPPQRRPHQNEPKTHAETSESNFSPAATLQFRRHLINVSALCLLQCVPLRPVFTRVFPLLNRSEDFFRFSVSPTRVSEKPRSAVVPHVPFLPPLRTQPPTISPPPFRLVSGCCGVNFMFSLTPTCS